MLSIVFEAFTDRCGAHPNSLTTYFNVRAGTGVGTEIQLEDILLPNKLGELNARAEKRFREVQKNKDMKFALNRNFGISKEGLVFYFNEYELGSHADGPTKLLLPWSDLDGLLNAEGMSIW